MSKVVFYLILLAFWKQITTKTEDMMSSFPENNEYETFGKQNKDEMSKHLNLPSSSFKIFTNKRVKQTPYCREK